MKKITIITIIVILCSALSAGNFSWFSQNDSRWNSERLGSSRSSIGNSGCVLSCLAMLLNTEASNTRMTPDRLNDWLRRNGGFAGNNMRWQIPGEIDGSGFGLELVSQSARRNDWDYLSGELSKGNKVIVKVAGRRSHWVLVVEQRGPANVASSYIVNDPGMTTYQERTLAYFGGFKAARSYSGNWLDEDAFNMDSEIVVQDVSSDELFLYELGDLQRPTDVYVTLSNRLSVPVTGFFMLALFNSDGTYLETIDHEYATVDASGSLDLIYQMPDVSRLKEDDLRIVYSKYFSDMPSIYDTFQPVNQRVLNNTQNVSEASESSLN